MSLRHDLCALSIAALAFGCSDEPADSSSSNDSQQASESDASTARDAASKTDAASTSTVRDAGESGSTGTADEPDAGAPPRADASTASTRDAATDAAISTPTNLDKFSFFVTSLAAMQRLSGSQNGFGGDLRFGETGDGAGLRGADKICTAIAEASMPGSGSKVWRAFLSSTTGGASNGAVNAIDRVGAGPWYDRLGRLVAANKTDLVTTRPTGADAAIKNDLPNEDGVPNHNPDGKGTVDNHHVLTGSTDKGLLYKNDVKVTCSDWTKSKGESADAPRVGLSWPRTGGGGASNWISAMDEAGCGAGVGIVEMGGPNESNPTVGSGGGYGAIYCLALAP
jgi:hypothetical protein